MQYNIIYIVLYYTILYQCTAVHCSDEYIFENIYVDIAIQTVDRYIFGLAFTAVRGYCMGQRFKSSPAVWSLLLRSHTRTIPAQHSPSSRLPYPLSILCPCLACAMCNVQCALRCIVRSRNLTYVWESKVIADLKKTKETKKIKKMTNESKETKRTKNTTKKIKKIDHKKTNISSNQELRDIGCW